MSSGAAGDGGKASLPKWGLASCTSWRKWQRAEGALQTQSKNHTKDTFLTITLIFMFTLWNQNTLTGTFVWSNTSVMTLKLFFRVNIWDFCCYSSGTENVWWIWGKMLAVQREQTNGCMQSLCCSGFTSSKVSWWICVSLRRRCSRSRSGWGRRTSPSRNAVNTFCPSCSSSKECESCGPITNRSLKNDSHTFKDFWVPWWASIQKQSLFSKSNEEISNRTERCYQLFFLLLLFRMPFQMLFHSRVTKLSSRFSWSDVWCLKFFQWVRVCWGLKCSGRNHAGASLKKTPLNRSMCCPWRPQTLGHLGFFIFWRTSLFSSLKHKIFNTLHLFNC